MLIIHLAIAVILYSVGSAVVKASSSREAWKNSLLSNLAIKSIKFGDAADDGNIDKLLSKNFWGPRELTRTKVPFLGIFNIFKDVWGAGRFLQILSILYATYMSVFSTFGPAMSLIVTLAFYLAIVVSIHVIYKYGVMKTEPNRIRIVAVLGLVAMLTFMVIRLNKVKYSNYKKDNREIIDRYNKLRDSITNDNNLLYERLSSLNLEYESYKSTTDSLLKEKITSEEDYRDAVDYLNEFVKTYN